MGAGGGCCPAEGKAAGSPKGTLGTAPASQTRPGLGSYLGWEEGFLGFLSSPLAGRWQPSGCHGGAFLSPGSVKAPRPGAFAALGSSYIKPCCPEEQIGMFCICCVTYTPSPGCPSSEEGSSSIASANSAANVLGSRPPLGFGFAAGRNSKTTLGSASTSLDHFCFKINKRALQRASPESSPCEPRCWMGFQPAWEPPRRRARCPWSLAGCLGGRADA